MSFQELTRSGQESGFNRIIISGVLVYICDNDVHAGLKGLAKLLEEKCVIFVWEPCGKEQRLTLKDFPSGALKTDYNAIYRTKNEYDDFFKVFTDNGFTVTYKEYYSALGGTVTYADTDKIYYILER